MYNSIFAQAYSDGEENVPEGAVDKTFTLTVGDFNGSTDYQTILVGSAYLHSYGSGFLPHVDVRWCGNVDFYLDGFELRSWYNKRLFKDPDSTVTFNEIKEDFAKGYNRNGGSLGILYRLYVDEPKYNEYCSYGKLNELAREEVGKSIAGATGGIGGKIVAGFPF